MITWDTIQDHHVKGNSSLGSVWIRLNREGKVTGMYTLFGNTVKYTPDEEWMEEVEAAKLILEEKHAEAESTVAWGTRVRLKNGSKPKK